MEWNGFKMIEFDFEGQPAKVIMPKERKNDALLILKTEYFGAFPDTEIKLLEDGNYLGFIKNKNRWGIDEDVDRKARFIDFVTEKYSLKKKCVPVGMSCGGIFAVKLAARYPEKIACIYLDAPVVNYMSCPCGFYKSVRFNENHEEIIEALGLAGIPQLLAYRDMPLDNLPKLAENRIPAIIVAGDSDTIVPFDENGIFIKEIYEKNNIPLEVYIKEGCDHHPHGLDDTTPVINFIKKYS
ncbi:MAG: alpha/beta hydrolase [Clostridia bacterium]|nr:alpha/beta hydrolase [Clostridia bacterium]